MFVEFQKQLEWAISELPEEMLLGVKKEHLPRGKILTSPKRVDGTIYSTVAIEIAHFIQDATTSRVSPYKIAKALVFAICNAKQQIDFFYELGPSGQINIDWDEGSDFTLLKGLLEKGEFCFSSENLESFWGEKKGELLFSRFALSSQVRELVRGSGLESWDSKLQALALLGDKELGASSYLSGFYARENVPWYLQCLERDLIKFKSVVSSSLSSFNQVNDVFLHHIAHCFRHLSYFRGIKEKAFVCSKPELLVGYLLDLGSNFYTIYNRPEMRVEELKLDVNTQARLLIAVNSSLFAYEAFSGALSDICKHLTFPASGFQLKEANNLQ